MIQVRQRRQRNLLLALVAVFYLLHQDVWLWNDPRLVAGLPIGLAYHVAYCLVAAVLMLALVRALLPHDKQS